MENKLQKEARLILEYHERYDLYKKKADLFDELVTGKYGLLKFVMTHFSIYVPVTKHTKALANTIERILDKAKELK